MPLAYDDAPRSRRLRPAVELLENAARQLTGDIDRVQQALCSPCTQDQRRQLLGHERRLQRLLAGVNDALEVLSSPAALTVLFAGAVQRNPSLTAARPN